MAITPHLNDGETFIKGRSEAKARELLEAAESAGVDASEIRTTSHGYIVPDSLASSVEGETTKPGDRPAVPTEPGTSTNPDEVTNVGGLNQDADKQVADANEAAERQASTAPDQENPPSLPETPEASDPERTTDSAESGTATPVEAQTEEGQFDPGDHTVDEVWAYLEDANDAERKRVLDAEAADKNRKAFQSEGGK